MNITRTNVSIVPYSYHTANRDRGWGRWRTGHGDIQAVGSAIGNRNVLGVNRLSVGQAGIAHLYESGDARRSGRVTGNTAAAMSIVGL